MNDIIMNKKRLMNISKYISLILRHKPEVIGMSLDKHGWAEVEQLINGIKQQYAEFDMEILEEIVRTDSKQRYSFNQDKTLIRANQGHSVNVDVELKEQMPPSILYHGTGGKYMDSIKEQGLVGKTRLYVHLSCDLDTAKAVGKRHCKSNESPILLRIDTKQMYEDGFQFYVSENKVWLTKEVPIKYITQV